MDTVLKKRRISASATQVAPQDVDYVPAAYAKPLAMIKMKNKARRAQLFDKLKREREKLRRANERRRKENPEVTHVIARPQRTLDNTREADETIVKAADEEVFEDEDVDEFAAYFDEGVKPRIILTTSMKPSKEAIVAVKEMCRVFPNSEYCKRKNYNIKVRGFCFPFLTMCFLSCISLNICCVRIWSSGPKPVTIRIYLFGKSLLLAKRGSTPSL